MIDVIYLSPAQSGACLCVSERTQPTNANFRQLIISDKPSPCGEAAQKGANHFKLYFFQTECVSKCISR